jgi:galactonate dehydratase
LKITKLETIRLGEFPNLLWVRVHTDEGLVGLGETYMGAAAAEAHVHDFAAPRLLGRNPLEIERLNRALVGYVGRSGTGAEMRGNSAIDIALWDLFGKAVGRPLVQVLGGASRDAIRIYNTCAGYRYIRNETQQRTDNFGLEGSEGPYEDLEAFLSRADELAASLLEQGITGMKIWPFDFAAEASNGLYISGPDLDRALEPFRKIRRAAGNRMDIMVEFHSLWSLPAAQNPIRMDGLASLKAYARTSPAPVCASEMLATRYAFRDLLETGAVGYVMLDICWCGGLTEARKIAAMADAWHLPVAPHDCVGPVVLAASTHLSLHAPNAIMQETVRAFYTGWYRELVTELPRIEKGTISVSSKAGIGLELLPDLVKRKDARVRESLPH